MNLTRTRRNRSDAEIGNVRRSVAAAVAIVAMFVVLGAYVVRDVLADPTSPISITQTANPSPVQSGAQLTYTITMVNTGSAKITNLALTDQLNGVGGTGSPPQLQLTTTLGSCTQTALKVACNAATLNGGQSWTLTITGVVTAASGTALNNTVSVTGTKSAQNFTTNNTLSTSVTGSVAGDLPDLTIAKTGPSSIQSGTPITYTLTVNNIGTANTSNVKVVDTLPTGITGIAASGTSLFVCGVSGQTVTCTGGTVNAGSNATITITGSVTAVAGSTLTNTAVVNPDHTIVESNYLNNTSSLVNTLVTSAPPPPSMVITKTEDVNPDTPGNTETYRIHVMNPTSSRATNVVVTDGTQGLAATGLVVSYTLVNGQVGTGGGCVVAAPQVTCSFKVLNASGTIDIVITGQVIASAGSTIINTASVTANINNTGVSNTASVTAVIKPNVDLTITKSDNPDPVCARSWPQTTAPNNNHLPTPAATPAASGDVPTLLAPPVCLGGLTYTFVVGNSGINGNQASWPSHTGVTGVTVRDPLPSGLIFDSYNAPAFSGGCSVDGSNVLTCSGGTLGPESTTTITIMVVAPPTVGTITNMVTVNPYNTIHEDDTSNNTGTDTTQVTTGVDLVVLKSDSSQQPPAGAAEPTLVPGTATALNDGYDPIATRGTETYTIYVGNVGTQDTTGIHVQDTLPADTVFLSAVPDATHGLTCSYSAGIVDCVGGHLRGTASDFYKPAGSSAPPPGDDFITIKIRVFARHDVGTMHNVVRVNPLNEIPEVNNQNDIATQDTTVTNGGAALGAFNDLQITKTQISPANNGPVATNGVLKYQLVVTNDGTDPAGQSAPVVVQDTLPTGSRFISAVDSVPGPNAYACSQASGVVTCTGGTMSGTINMIAGVAQTRTITIVVFAPNAVGNYQNQAIVDPNNAIAEGNEFNNISTISTAVQTCSGIPDCTAKNAYNELTITKTQNRPTIARNGKETYTLTVENDGSDPVSGITVQDTPPAGSRFIDAMDTSPGPNAFTCGVPDASGVITCTGGSLSGQATTIPGVPTSRQITVDVFAPDTPGTYTNQSVVDPFNTIPEGNEFNNVSSVNTVVKNGGPNPWIDLTITKTQTNPSTVAPGDPLIYNLHVTNNGEGDAFGVEVQDILPLIITSGRGFDSAGGAGAFTCSTANQVVDCTGGTIPAGGSRDITVGAFAPTHLFQYFNTAAGLGNISVTIRNQAIVNPNGTIPEGDTTNNTATVDTTVTPTLNLSIKKTGPDSATQSSNQTYVLDVKNSGPGDAFGVQVHDPLPVGMIVTGVDFSPTNAWQCQVQQNPVNVVDCQGDLPASVGDVTINIHVFVTATDGTTLANQACVDPNNLIDETNKTDNCSTQVTTVSENPVVNMTINKSAATGTVNPGDTETYTLTVSNNGNGDAVANDVTVKDNLPTGMTINGTPTTTNGFDCSASTTTVLSCTNSGATLAAGTSATITFIANVPNSAVGQIKNTATVTANDDTGTANKSSSATINVGAPAVDLTVSNVTGTSINGAGQITPPGTLTFTVAASNLGTGATPAGAVHIANVLNSSAGLTLVGASGTNGWTCGSLVGLTVDCQSLAAGMAAGDSTTLTLKFMVTTATNPIVLTSTIDPNNVIAESNEANNTASATVSVNPSGACTSCKDLSAAIFAAPNPAKAGSTVTFSGAVVNIGDQDVIGTSGSPAVLFYVQVPTGFTYSNGDVTVSGPNPIGNAWACAKATPVFPPGTNANTLICKGDLPVGQGVTFSISTTAPSPGSTTTYTATIQADPGHTVETGDALDSDSIVETVNP